MKYSQTITLMALLGAVTCEELQQYGELATSLIDEDDNEPEIKINQNVDQLALHKEPIMSPEDFQKYFKELKFLDGDVNEIKETSSQLTDSERKDQRKALLEQLGEQLSQMKDDYSDSQERLEFEQKLRDDGVAKLRERRSETETIIRNTQSFIKEQLDKIQEIKSDASKKANLERQAEDTFRKIILTNQANAKEIIYHQQKMANLKNLKLDLTIKQNKLEKQISQYNSDLETLERESRTQVNDARTIYRDSLNEASENIISNRKQRMDEMKKAQEDVMAKQEDKLKIQLKVDDLQEKIAAVQKTLDGAVTASTASFDAVNHEQNNLAGKKVTVNSAKDEKDEYDAKYQEVKEKTIDLYTEAVTQAQAEVEDATEDVDKDEVNARIALYQHRVEMQNARQAGKALQLELQETKKSIEDHQALLDQIDARSKELENDISEATKKAAESKAQSHLSESNLQTDLDKVKQDYEANLSEIQQQNEDVVKTRQQKEDDARKEQIDMITQLAENRASKEIVDKSLEQLRKDLEASRSFGIETLGAINDLKVKVSETEAKYTKALAAKKMAEGAQLALLNVNSKTQMKIRSELGALQAELSAAKHLSDNTIDLKRQLEAVKDSIKTGITTDIELNQSDKNTMSEEISQIEEDLKNIQNELQSLKTNEADLVADKDEAEEAVNKAEDDFADLKASELAADIDRVDGLNKELEGTDSDMDAKITEVATQISDLQKKIDEITASLQAAQSADATDEQKAEASTLLSDLTRQQSELNSAIQRKAELEKTREDIIQQKATHAQEHIDLKKSYKEKEVRLGYTLNEARNVLAEVQEKIKGAKAEIKENIQKSDDFVIMIKEKEDDMKDIDEEIAKLKEKLDKVDIEFDTENKDREMQENQLKVAQDQILGMQQEKVDKKKDELDKLVEINTKKEDEAKQQVIIKTKELVELTAQTRLLNEQLNKSVQQMAIQKKTVEKLETGELQDLEKAKSDYDKVYNENFEKYEAAKTKFAELMEQSQQEHIKTSQEMMGQIAEAVQTRLQDEKEIQQGYDDKKAQDDENQAKAELLQQELLDVLSEQNTENDTLKKFNASLKEIEEKIVTQTTTNTNNDSKLEEVEGIWDEKFKLTSEEYQTKVKEAKDKAESAQSDQLTAEEEAYNELEKKAEALVNAQKDVEDLEDKLKVSKDKLEKQTEEKVVNEAELAKLKIKLNDAQELAEKANKDSDDASITGIESLIENQQTHINDSLSVFEKNLSDAVDKLTDKVSKFEIIKSFNESQLKISQHEFDNRKSQIKDIEAQLDSEQRVYDDLLIQQKDGKVKLNTAKLDKDDASKAFLDLQKKIESQSEKIQKLYTTRFKSSKEETDRIANAQAVTQAKINSILQNSADLEENTDEKFKKLGQQLDEVQDKIEAQKLEIIKAQKFIKDKQELRLKEYQKMQNITENMNEVEDQIQDVDFKLANLNQNQNQQRSTLTAELLILEKKVVEQKKQIAEFDAQINKMESEIKELKESLDEQLHSLKLDEDQANYIQRKMDNEKDVLNKKAVDNIQDQLDLRSQEIDLVTHQEQQLAKAKLFAEQIAETSDQSKFQKQVEISMLKSRYEEAQKYKQFIDNMVITSQTEIEKMKEQLQVLTEKANQETDEFEKEKLTSLVESKQQEVDSSQKAMDFFNQNQTASDQQLTDIKTKLMSAEQALVERKDLEIQLNNDISDFGKDLEAQKGEADKFIVNLKESVQNITKQINQSDPTQLQKQIDFINGADPNANLSSEDIQRRYDEYQRYVKWRSSIPNSEPEPKRHSSKHAEVPSWAVWFFGLLICMGAGGFVMIIKNHMKKNGGQEEVNVDLRDENNYDRRGTRRSSDLERGNSNSRESLVSEDAEQLDRPNYGAIN